MSNLTIKTKEGLTSLEIRAIIMSGNRIKRLKTKGEDKVKNYLEEMPKVLDKNG